MRAAPSHHGQDRADPVYGKTARIGLNDPTA
jgi:hypothetical protein